MTVNLLQLELRTLQAQLTAMPTTAPDYQRVLTEIRSLSLRLNGVEGPLRQLNF